MSSELASNPPSASVAHPAPLEVAVLLFDPKLPYSFSHTGQVGEEELEAAQRLRDALAGLEGYRFSFFDDHARLIDDLRGRRFDLALNFCDVGYRNDWNKVEHIPALLEMLDIPYTGSGTLALLVSADKALVRALAIDDGILVPDEIFVDLTAEPLRLPRTYPALIKPNGGGGSFGISQQSVVHDAEAARAHLRFLAGRIEPAQAVIQEFLTGIEYTVGVVGNPETGLEVLPPMEVDYSGLDPDLPPVFTYEAKFDSESRYYQQIQHRQAEMDDRTRERLGVACTHLFRRLGFRDYARFDFRCGADGVPRFLDANPNPTWYWSSRLSIMAGYAGYDYPDLIRRILEAARQRALHAAGSTQSAPLGA